MAAGAVWEGLRKAETRSLPWKRRQWRLHVRVPRQPPKCYAPGGVSPIQPAARFPRRGVTSGAQGGEGCAARCGGPLPPRSGRGGHALQFQPGIVIEKGLWDPWTPELHFRPPTPAPSTIVPPYAGGSVVGVPCWSSVGSLPLPTWLEKTEPPHVPNSPPQVCVVDFSIPVRPNPEVPSPSLPAILRGLQQGNFVRSSRVV